MKAQELAQMAWAIVAASDFNFVTYLPSPLGVIRHLGDVCGVSQYEIDHALAMTRWYFDTMSPDASAADYAAVAQALENQVIGADYVR